jgi:hypothetical protein
MNRRPNCAQTSAIEITTASPHQTNQGATRSNAADNCIDKMSGDLFQNFTRGSELMGFDVFRV